MASIIISNPSCTHRLMHVLVVQSPEDLKKEKKKDISFFRKFLELQGLMLHHNSQLTKSHPYSSAPITWPFVVRGISFWETAEGLKQIYLLGNPFAWYVLLSNPTTLDCIYIYYCNVGGCVPLGLLSMR